MLRASLALVAVCFCFCFCFCSCFCACAGGIESGEGEGEGDVVGAGEGEGEGESCGDGVFGGADEGAPVVVYVDGFRVGVDAACAVGELYEVYFELEDEVSIDDVGASFDGGEAVAVSGVHADFDGHRGDACGPAATTSVPVAVQVRGAGGASVPVCGTAF